MTWETETGSGTIENPDRVESNGLGYPVGGAADRARHVSAVAVAVGHPVAILDRVEAEGGAPSEVDMGAQDPGIDDVDVNAAPSGANREVVAERQVALIDPVQAPGRSGRLGSGNTDDLVGFNRSHIRILAQPGDVGWLHLHRETA